MEKKNIDVVNNLCEVFADAVVEKCVKLDLLDMSRMKGKSMIFESMTVPLTRNIKTGASLPLGNGKVKRRRLMMASDLFPGKHIISATGQGL